MACFFPFLFCIANMCLELIYKGKLVMRLKSQVLSKMTTKKLTCNTAAYEPLEQCMEEGVFKSSDTPKTKNNFAI